MTNSRMLQPFVPQSPIEQQIVDVQAGNAAADALILALVETDLFVPSQDLPSLDGTRFAPVVLEADGVSFIPAFTAASRQSDDMGMVAVQMTGRRFFTLLPPGMGAVINPGHDAQLFLPPDGIAALQEDLQRTP